MREGNPIIPERFAWEKLNLKKEKGHVRILKARVANRGGGNVRNRKMRVVSRLRGWGKVSGVREVGGL